MTPRALAEVVFAEAVIACDPAVRVRAAIEELSIARSGFAGPRSAAEGQREASIAGRRRIGIAVGKAARAMARGAGEVDDGIVVAPARHGVGEGGAEGEGEGTGGWRVLESAHPLPDESSVAAARAVRQLVASAAADDVVLVLISGGASALIEQPRDGITLAELRDVAGLVMASGAPIHELNAVRSLLSAVKAGGLIADCAAPVVTLIVSDVIGDDPRVIGSGPTVIVPRKEVWLAAARVLSQRNILPMPASVMHVLHAGVPWPSIERPRDEVRVIAPIDLFAHAVERALRARGCDPRRIEAPLVDDVAVVADQLAALADTNVVAWGEPTLRVPDEHGEGGRAQQLALELAMRIRGTSRTAFVAGSDGVDGPWPRGRAAPAGAFVDGTTWDAIAAAGLDPAAALARRDAGTALASIGALFLPGPTGINHADLAILL